MAEDGRSSPKIRALDENFGPLPEQEPKPRTKPRPAAAPKTATPKGNLQQDIAALLVYANMMLAPIIREDIMDDVEILALSKAIDEQAKKSPRFRAAIQRMMTAMGGTGLIGVVIIIGARRAARHGVIPAEWDQNLASYLALSQMSPAQMMGQLEEVMAAQMAAAAAEQEANDTDSTTATQPRPVPAEAPTPS